MITVVVLGLVFLSGATGLIYQVTWQKYLTIFLGSHALATSLVLATFFLFMALGYFWLGRWTSRILKDKILLYGAVEGVIGVYAVLSPSYFKALNEIFSSVSVTGGAELALQAVFTGLFIGLPTFLMGGTIPILTEGLVRNFSTSHRVHALIYSLNTLGAFLGTLIAGFILIEAWGLERTLIATGWLNILIFLGAAAVSARHPGLFHGLEPATEAAPTDVVPARLRMGLYVVSFFSGFYVFSLESLLIRMAGIALGSSAYTYSIIVSAFIFSIAVGSSLVSALKRLDERRIFLWVQMALFVSTTALYLTVPAWPEWLNRVRALVHSSPLNFGFFYFLICVTFFAMLLVPVGLMGMNLPLLFGVLKDRRQHLAQVVGQVYAVNCMGSVIGTMIGGYALFHILGADAIFKITLGMVTATFLALALLFANRRLQWMAVGAGAGGLVLVFLLPSWPMNRFIPGLFLNPVPGRGITSYSDWVRTIRRPTGEFVFSKFDVNTLVNVTKGEEGHLTLYVNAKPDADTKADHLVRGMNALIPISVAPRIENVFVIGLGTGLSTGIISRFSEVKNLEVAELSQGVIEALPLFDTYAYGVLDRRSKYRIHNQDAYKVLKSSDALYDVIISEPSNPWVAGVEKLFSLEFLVRAASRLKEGGLYAQWFPLFQIDAESLVMILGNFNSVFPWTSVWTTSSGVLLITGSNRPVEVAAERLKARFEEQKDLYAEFGFHDSTSILGRQLLTPLYTRALTLNTSQFHTLEHPQLGFRAGRALFAAFPMVNIERLILASVAKPVDRDIPANRFLFQQFQDSLPKTFFDDNFIYMKKTSLNSDNGSLFHWKRFRHEFLNRFPERADAKTAENLQKYRHLSEGAAWRSPGSSAPGGASLHDWVQKYASLIAMQLPADLGRVLEKIPEKCRERDDDCLKAKESLIRLRRGSSAPSDLNLTSDRGRAALEDHFRSEFKDAQTL